MTIDKTKTLYKILLHPVLGYLIFLFVMWLTFFCTFQLGNYFMEFMEAGVDALGTFAYENIPKGFFNDLVVQGIIGGV